MNRPIGQDEDVLHNMLLTCAEASVPYAFRKSTGLVAELSFIAGRTLQFLHETLSVARVLNEGLDALLSNSAAVERLRAQVRQTRAGGELLSNDLHPMYAIVIVDLCAALDAGIDDTLTVALRFRPGTITHLHQLGVTKLIDADDRDLTYIEARQMLTRLKQFTRSEKVAPNGWLLQLEAIGLTITLTEDHRRALRELIYVRNCLIHGGGRADEKCSRETSVLPMQAGKKIRVVRAAMAAYTTACLAVASGIAEAALKPFLAWKAH